MQSVGGGAAVTAVTVVTALTAVAAVIDSGGREAGVPAVKLLAAAVTARAPSGAADVPWGARKHHDTRATRPSNIYSRLMCNCTNANPSTLQPLQQSKHYNTLKRLHVAHLVVFNYKHSPMG